MAAALSQFELARPALLWLALVVPVLAVIAWRSSAGHALWRRVASSACRAALVVLLVLACAGLSFREAVESRFVVLVVDASLSTAGEARHRADEYLATALEHRGTSGVAILTFAGQPGILRRELAATLAVADDHPSDGRSNPAKAVRLAAASIPPEHLGRIVLLTDGRQTDGDLLAAARSVSTPISVVPLNGNSSREVYLDRVIVSQASRRTGVFEGRATIYSNHDDRGSLDVLVGSDIVKTEQAEVSDGETIVSFRASIGDAETAVCQVRLRDFDDTRSGNNRGSALVTLQRQLRLLLVASESRRSRHLRQTLVEQAYAVEIRPTADVAADAEALSRFDAIILRDVSPNDFSTHQLAALDEYVKKLGGGLISVGGETTYAAGIYRDSALERMLPVAAPGQVDQIQTDLALVMVIDKSESMLEQNRLVLAKKGASRVVGLLSQRDRLGVIAFSNHAEWISPIEPLTNKALLLSRIDKLNVEDQTNMYPALERAYLALRQTRAESKHIILLTDGVSSPGDFAALARRMYESGIRVSTVTVGEGADQSIPKDIARIAGGRHRHCAQAADLADIVVQVAETAALQAIANDVSAVVARRLPDLEVETAPALSAHAVTASKRGSQLLLITPAGHPLLSWWRYGAGVSMSFTADLDDEGASGWRQWPGYGPFWERLIRHAARHQDTTTTEVMIVREGRRATVTIDVVDRSLNYVNDAAATVIVERPGGATSEMTMPQSAPGRYQQSFPADELGGYRLTVACRIPNPGDSSSNDSNPDDSISISEIYRGTHGLFVDFPDELRVGPADVELLKTVARISGGSYDPPPTEVFQAGGRSRVRSVALWSDMLKAALVLLMIDVLLRRFDTIFPGSIVQRSAAGSKAS